jgi:L-asparaginase/Glu-tRNA(Gln) amidotransferase subunit D
MPTSRFGKTEIGGCVIACVFAVMDLPSAQTPPPSTLPAVVVISTGGTIAGRGVSSTSLSNYKSGAWRERNS